VAGAYVINDIQDIGTDTINKTKKVIVNQSITENAAFNLYIGLNILGVVLAFYLSNLVGKPNLTGIFILVALTFYFYANQLKSIFLVGLFLKVLLSSLIILVLPLYEMYPLIDETNQTEYATLLKVMVDFAILTILLNLTREILKDLASKNGDYNEGYPTLPIILGTKRIHFLSLILVLTMVILVSAYTYFYLWINNLHIATAYNLAFVLTPLIFVLIQLFSSQKHKEYIKMGKMLKYVLFFACFSIVIITHTISK
jgi:4-hydroxybenzoate polyprenyltransferase